MNAYLVIGIDKRKVDPIFMGVFPKLELAKNFAASLDLDKYCPFDGAEIYAQEGEPDKNSKMKRVWWKNFE